MQFYFGLLALLALGALACIAVMPWLSLAFVQFGLTPLIPSEFVDLSAWPWLLGSLVAGVVLYALGRWMSKAFART